jgi:hypothetical protein
MVIFEIVVPIFLIVFGIPNKIIDAKHRKRNAYEFGHAWGYYTKLSKAGSWEGKFMVWSAYLGVALVLALFIELFYDLSR